ncbi:isochorismatase family protein [Arthrobacter sp. MI7-26]|uniref:isochorismatase family protein n=1 Tax=Arthrobacter sp. MI7-26 TaxID=2993653 RepID=UPI0022488610|nr:isochorismatase family protein [Arthrobacter sp. MI7-26]MCX2749818.1 isochorismatase family protein [Arthrobacter sp. MI7-26]
MGDSELAHIENFGRPMGPGNSFAVVIVDLQKAFTDPTRPLGCDLDNVVGSTREIVDAARAAGAPVIFTVVGYRPDGLDIGLWALKAPKISTLVIGSDNVELDDRLGHQDDEPLIVKKSASACFGTTLADDLLRLGVDSVILTGTSTSGCVRASAVDLFQNGFRVFVPREAVGDREPETHANSLRDLDLKYADVVSTETAKKFLGRVNSND